MPDASNVEAVDDTSTHCVDVNRRGLSSRDLLLGIVVVRDLQILCNLQIHCKRFSPRNCRRERPQHVRGAQASASRRTWLKGAKKKTLFEHAHEEP